MNQLKRALKMKPSRLIKKICCFEEVYTIAYRKRDEHTLLDSDKLLFESIPYNDMYWYADPILVSYRGTDYLFMEAFDMRTQRGSIACAWFDKQGVLSNPKIVIEEDYHMSFPMIFSWNDGLYMIPETSDNHSLNLYRCEGDITQWKLVESFPTTKQLVDTVVTACQGNYVSLLSSAISPDDLLQYQWQKFILLQEDNGLELKEDMEYNAEAAYRRADRMAGSIVRINGSVILPTQESTEVDYGVNLYLNDFAAHDLEHMKAVKKITVDNIQLPAVKQKEMIGIHSYAVSEQFEVVDVRYFRFSPLNRVKKILRKFV